MQTRNIQYHLRTVAWLPVTLHLSHKSTCILVSTGNSRSVKCFIHEMTNQQAGLFINVKCDREQYSTAALCPGISHSATATQAASVLFSAQHRCNVVLFTALLEAGCYYCRQEFHRFRSWKFWNGKHTGNGMPWNRFCKQEALTYVLRPCTQCTAQLVS